MYMYTGGTPCIRAQVIKYVAQVIQLLLKFMGHRTGQ
jgi:hypothetical protein